MTKSQILADTATHEHTLTLLVAAEQNELRTPVRYCLECGMVMFCFDKPYVMVPEWSKERLQQFAKETIKLVAEQKPAARPKRALGRGLKEIMSNTPPAGGGLFKLLGKN